MLINIEVIVLCAHRLASLACWTTLQAEAWILKHLSAPKEKE